MHECVFTARGSSGHGVRALDIAKRLMDFGYHPPTIYFPLIVPEALMIEPTETESSETLDTFIAAMRQIADEIEKDPEIVKSAPHVTIVRKLDEATAARQPCLLLDSAGGEPDEATSNALAVARGERSRRSRGRTWRGRGAAGSDRADSPGAARPSACTNGIAPAVSMGRCSRKSRSARCTRHCRWCGARRAGVPSPR